MFEWQIVIKSFMGFMVVMTLISEMVTKNVEY